MTFSRSLFLRGAAALGLAAATLTHAAATEADAILQALVKKGVISQTEAAKIQDDAHADEQQSSANKLKLSNGLSELRLYGDIRMRYQFDNKDEQVDPPPLPGRTSRSPSGNQEDRVRIRLRLNADFKIGPQIFGGVQIQTGYASDTGNQTFGDGFSNYPIFLSRVFLGYQATPWLMVEAGKVANPFYTTEMMWDPDINPSGFVEQVEFHKLYNRQTTTLMDKDGKSVTEETAPPWELTLLAGQFVFDDNVEGGGGEPGRTDTDSNTDPWLFETQLIGTYNFGKVTATVAPAWLVYTAGTLSVPSDVTSTFGDINTNSFKDTALVSGATRNLSILNFPGDIRFKLGRIPTKIYWDVAYNIDGRQRAEDTYHLINIPDPTNPKSFSANHHTRDDFAWLIGFQLGENKKKGDLSFLANYRELGISAVDPNLTDNEFGLGELNLRGFRVSLNYNLTDAAVFSVNYYGAWNLDRNLIGGEATGDNAIADANAVQVLQVDLNVKF